MPKDPPLIGVMPDKFMAGANALDDPVNFLTVKPLPEALLTPWPTDAHFVCYSVAAEVEWPRCNKPLLPTLRRQGADIYSTIMAFDYDNPGHGGWTPDLWQEFLAKLDSIADQWPMAWQWCCLYRTKNGARLVYVLDAPVPVDQCEGKVRWMIQQFGVRGLTLDRLCDWTRCFRCPMVTRDGQPTWEQDYFDIIEQWDQSINPNDLPYVEPEKGAEYGAISAYDGNRPNDTLASALLYESVGKMSAWFKEARKRLRGRDCYPILFDAKPLAEPGGRNNALHSLVGQVVALLFMLAGTTPEHVYALCLDCVLTLETDAQTPDWSVVLWDHVCRLWGKEEAKQQIDQEKQAEHVEQVAHIEDVLIDGVRSWCDQPTLEDRKEARFWLSRRLIASCGNSYFIMRPDGFYDDLPLLSQQVIARVRALGMQDLISTTRITDEGKVIDRNISEVLNRHMTVVKKIQARPEVKGGYIIGMDSSEAVLMTCAYRRNPQLEPRYSPHVDEWLKMFFGPTHYEAGVNWIAWALAFDEGPICALSIKADPGAGKKMLAEGLAECLEAPRLATEQDLVSDTQYGLMESPFLLVNEGWPQKTYSGKHPADEFRHLVGGDSKPINRKFVAPVHVLNPVRVIFTANNNDVVKQLTGNRNLSAEDRAALAVRLMHMEIGDRSANWLRLKGGRNFTNGWIRGDGGGESNFTVARHFLWLYENRKGPTGSRLLVEGNANDNIIFEMRTQSGSAPLVIETIIHMLNTMSPIQELTVENNHIWVLASGILSFFRSKMSSTTRERMTLNVVSSVLKGLVLGDPEEIRIMDSRRSLGKQRWKELDSELLLQVARRDGWRSQALETIVEAVRAERIGLKRARETATVNRIPI